MRRLLDKLNDDKSRERLRLARALEVLEQIGTDAARNLAKSWSEGDGEAWLTREAQQSVGRLAGRLSGK